MANGELNFNNEASDSSDTSGSLFDRAVLLSLNITSLGVKRKVHSSQYEVDAEKDFTHLSKDILKSPILDEIRKFDSKTRQWIAERSLPSLFRNGVYLWPISLVVEADSYLSTRIEQRLPMVERLIESFESIKADARMRLKSLFNTRDYPSAEKVRQSYSMSYQFIETGTPGRLRDISVEMFEREREKAASIWTDALTEAKDILRGELLGLVDHLNEVLQPAADGKKKRFHESTITNFNQFLDLFAPRNLANDQELAAVVDQCKAALSGVLIEDIRTNEQFRDGLRSKMDQVKGVLDTLVIKRGRRITIEDEAQAAESWGDL